MDGSTEIAIFPLNTVLFPSGVLPLRIFEARYMDMVRECMSRDLAFGVCLITDGAEVGEAARHEAIGCTARITGWDMQQQGVLNLRTIGSSRFRIVSQRVQGDRLIRARIQSLPDDPPAGVPPELEVCASLARSLAEQLSQADDGPMNRLIEAPCRFDEAGWVANRLAEFLPIPVTIRQRLMELDDPLARLAWIHRYLEQNQVI
jgi:uncharacterized protein